jgi:hypothetical protein
MFKYILIYYKLMSSFILCACVTLRQSMLCLKHLKEYVDIRLWRMSLRGNFVLQGCGLKVWRNLSDVFNKESVVILWKKFTGEASMYQPCMQHVSSLSLSFEPYFVGKLNVFMNWMLQSSCDAYMIVIYWFNLTCILIRFVILLWNSLELLIKLILEVYKITLKFCL